MQITFTSKETEKPVTGSIIEIPGFECLDLIFVQEGFFAKIYELATGMEFTTAKGFTAAEAKQDVIDEMAKKGGNAERILKKIKSEQHSLGRKAFAVINHSPKYEAYLKREADYKESLPFMYNEEERDELMRIIEIGATEGLRNMAVFSGHLKKKADGTRKTELQGILDAFERHRIIHHARLIKKSGGKLPKRLQIEWNQYEVTWDHMIEVIHANRKRSITHLIPQVLLYRFWKLWQLTSHKNNIYGYRRFGTGMSSIDLLRYTIDVKAGRDVTGEIERITADINACMIEIVNETQKYELPPHENFRE